MARNAFVVRLRILATITSDEEHVCGQTSNSDHNHVRTLAHTIVVSFVDHLAVTLRNREGAARPLQDSGWADALGASDWITWTPRRHRRTDPATALPLVDHNVLTLGVREGTVYKCHGCGSGRCALSARAGVARALREGRVWRRGCRRVPGR